MVDFMQRLPARLRKPDLILVISAHWEESAATLLAGENPPLFYDYYGFPAQAYQITYPAPGNPQAAQRSLNCWSNAFPTPRRPARPRRVHPLKLMYPHRTS
jgi:aromatic ring-opening dioxygenase catalytic subunit (LigB family)